MRDAQKPDHVSLNTLINWIKDGRFVIPDFQREFEWEPWDIKDLMRSLFLDYYIGSLLLWRGKKENFDALSCEKLFGFSDKIDPTHIVLDGQQRLTAIYYAFLAPDIPLPRRSNRAFYHINVDYFMSEDYEKAFNYEWSSQRLLGLLKDPSVQYEQHYFPLSIVGSGGWDLPNWVQGYEQYWRERVDEAKNNDDLINAEKAELHAVNARLFGEHLREITQQYQISYNELDRDLGIDKVCDIFTQINSKGVRLDIFDLMNALLKPKNLQLKQMWRDAKTRLEFVDSKKMNIYILQVMSILCQAYCSPKYLYFLLPGQEKPIREPDGTRRKEILIKDINDFEKQWNSAVDALEGSIKLLRHPQEFGAISPNYLPYISIIPAFAALQAHVKKIPPNSQLDAQRKIRQWYWASIFTNRYSGSVESTSARDFLDVKAWIEDDKAEPALIQEFKTRFSTLDLRRETTSGSSIYNGIFNLLVLKGARDWMTGNLPQYDDLDDHHIIPKSWGQNNLQNYQIHTILNRTPLTKETNRNVIRERLPNEYLSELIERNGKEKVLAILDSHFISPVALDILLRNPFTPDDFEQFISERQRTIQYAIEDLLIKERLDLPPHLRDLDEKIEQIELGLRKIIILAFDNEPRNILSNFLQKAEDRIQSAARKNPTMDITQFQTLERKLEYCDLRELQNIISNRALWKHFERYFNNRDSMDNKFNQLAELRNGIRHSRSIDPITQKEGEAAILWFEQVLKK